MAKLDNKTAVLPGLPSLPKKRGRPVTGEAVPAAKRMAAMRARRAAEAAEALRSLKRWTSLQIIRTLADGLQSDASDVQRALAKDAWTVLGHRMGWL